MSELEQAIKDARARHLERLTGPQTCCAKLGEPELYNGMRVCGEPVEYLEVGAKGNPREGWYHTSSIIGHHAVPESLIR